MEALKKGIKTPDGQPTENDGGESSSDGHPEENQILGADADEQEDKEDEEEEVQTQPDDNDVLEMYGSDGDEVRTQPAEQTLDDIAKSLLFNTDDDDSKVELAAQIHIPIPIAKNSKSGEIVFNISGLHPWRQLVWQLRISWLMPCWL